MSRPSPTRSRRAPGAAGATGASAPEQPLMSVLAQTTRPTDILPALHQHALAVTGGACSLLFQHNPRNGLLHATSGFHLDALRTDAWMPAPDESALVKSAFDRGAPTLVADADRQMPDIAERLGVPAVLLLPLLRGTDRVGLLAIGFARSPAASTFDAMPVSDAFVTSLELIHLRQREQLQRDLTALLDEFSTKVSATLTLSGGLDILCRGANQLFAADRTTVWIHERRARHLVVCASSDAEHIERGARIDAEDLLAPAANAMRGVRADIIPSGNDSPTATLTVPLRGRRRALGALVFEGARIDAGGELDVLDRVDELGRQLSSAIDNIQLLDDVVRSRRELENILDSISHLIAVVDARGHIVHVNNSFARRVGQTRDQLLDRPITELVGPELANWLERHRSGAVRSSADSAVTCETVDPILKGPFMVTATELRDNDQQLAGTVVVARDLVSQTQIEGEREELRRRLTQTEKLAALGQFVAGIAHELNNPLQGVLGHMELLRATGAFPKQLRREVATIYREADRAAKIVHNLLVFAGSRRVARRPVSLNGVLQKVVTLRATAHRALDIEVVRHYDERLPRVASDPLLLHQVFLNMVMNAEHAIAATGRPGRIELTTSLTRSSDRVVATVRDTGTGIPEGTLTRIFEPFYTTKEVGKGTGLGLAIAYGIVQEHGGHISAANHADGGAVFTVELPTTRPAGR